MRVLPADPDERRDVLPLILLTGLLGTAFLGASVAGYALLLQRLGPGGLTPVLLVAAVVAVAYGALDARLVRQGTLATRFTVLCGGAAVVALGAAAIEAAAATVLVAIAIPVLLEISATEGTKLVFELASRRFDIRQTKRLLGLVGSGRWIAYFAFGLLLWLAGDAIPAPVVLLACGIAFAAAGVLGRRLAADPADPDGQGSAGGQEGAGSAGTTDAVGGADVGRDQARKGSAAGRGRPLLRLIALQITVLFTIWIVTDYIFLGRADAAVSPEALPALFGAVGAAEGLVTLLFSVLGSGPLLARLGVTRSLTVAPVVLTVLTIALVATLLTGMTTLSLVVAVLLRLAERSLRNGLNRPAIAVLYQPLDPDLARARRAQLEGAYITVLAAVGSLVMGAILLTPVAAQLLAGVMVALTGLWLVLNRATATGYVEALRRGLDRRELGAGMTLDPALRGLLAERLADPDPLRALAAASLLSEFPESVQQATDALLIHPEERLRRIGLESARRSGVAVDATVLRDLAEAPDSDIGTRTLALASALDQGAEWARLATSTSLRHRPEVAVALLAARTSSLDRAEGQAQLTRAAADEDDRWIAARALAAAPSADAVEVIIALAEAADTDVAAEVLTTGPAIDDPRLWEVIARRVDDVALVPAATRALERGGSTAVPSVSTRLDDPTTTSSSRWRLARVLVRNGSAPAVQHALDLLDDEDVRVRTGVMVALGQHRPVLTEAQAQALRAGLRLVARRIHRLHRAAARSAGLLHGALCDAVRRERVALLGGVRALGTDEEARGMVNALERDDPRLRASRLELLETVISAEDRHLVASLESADPPPAPGGDETWRADGPAPDPWIALLSRMGQDHTVLSTVERVIALRTTEIFGASPPEVLLDVAEQMEDVGLQTGERLFEAGDLGDKLYVCVDGAISIEAGGAEVNRITRGQAFGELALLQPEPRTAAAVAAEDTVLLSLGGDTFDALLADRPEVAAAVMRYLAARLRAATVATQPVTPPADEPPGPR